MTTFQTAKVILLGAVAGLAAVVCTPRPAAAQTLETPAGRQGYYLGVGLYGGTVTSREDGDTLGTWSGNDFALRVGQLLTSRWSLGAQIDFGGAKKGQESAGLFGLGVETSYAVWRTLAVKAGIGAGVLTLKDDRVVDEDLRGGYGTQYTVGLSYDFFPWRKRLSGGFALAPAVLVRFVPSGDTSALSMLVGVDILWWTGRPRDQLQLPDSEAYQKR